MRTYRFAAFLQVAQKQSRKPIVQAVDSEIEVRAYTQTRSWVSEYWPVLLLALVTLALYVPVLGRLIRQWYDDANYSHGFLSRRFADT